jgi:hypothetical protein
VIVDVVALAGAVGSPVDAATLAVIVEARLRVLSRLSDRLDVVERTSLALARSEDAVDDDLVERDLPGEVDPLDVEVLRENGRGGDEP